MSEYDEQVRVFRWAEAMAPTHPALALLNASQNGAWLKSPKQAVNAKRAGMKNGVPDIFLPVPAGGFHGLFIELKHGKSKIRPEQKGWLQSLADHGYKSLCVWGADAAISEIEKYLGICK